MQRQLLRFLRRKCKDGLEGIFGFFERSGQDYIEEWIGEELGRMREGMDRSDHEEEEGVTAMMVSLGAGNIEIWLLCYTT